MINLLWVLGSFYAGLYTLMGIYVIRKTFFPYLTVGSVDDTSLINYPIGDVDHAEEYPY